MPRSKKSLSLQFDNLDRRDVPSAVVLLSTPPDLSTVENSRLYAAYVKSSLNLNGSSDKATIRLYINEVAATVKASGQSQEVVNYFRSLLVDYYNLGPEK